MSEMIAIDQIDPNPWQPRTSEDADHIANLAASIADDGLMQIPSARLVEGRYQLAFGHSRFAAFRLLAELQDKLQKQTPILFDEDSALARAVVAADKSLEANGPSFAEMPLNVIDLDDAGMFRAAISENLQRKDLTSIEEARAMKRAMDEFKYTSVQVGALFGKSDATVRGKIRLLDLPEAVQVKLADGELSEGTARTLLTVKKVIGDEKLGVLAGQVAEYKNPEGVQDKLRMVLNDVKNCVLLFDRWQTGEPTAGSGLWPLSTWTFSTNPSMAQAAKAAKEWQGARWIQSSDGNESAILTIFQQLALAGSEKWGNLAQENPAWNEAIAHFRSLCGAPICTACPMYMKLDKTHYCGDKGCWKRKKEAWISEQFDIFAAGSVTLPLTDGDAFLNTDDWSDRDLYKELYEKQDPHLRLKKSFNEYSTHSFTESKFAKLVDVSPERIAAKEAKAQQKNSAEADRELEYERRNRRRDASNAFILERAYRLFVQGFVGLDNLGAMMSLAGISNDRKIDGGTLFADLPRDQKLDVLRLAITRNVLSNAIPWQMVMDGPIVVAKHLAGLAVTWGIDLPVDWLDIAQGYEPFPSEPIAPVAESASDDEDDPDDNEDGFYDEELTEDELEAEEE